MSEHTRALSHRQGAVDRGGASISARARSGGSRDKTVVHLCKALELAQLFNLRSLLPEIFETYANFYRDTEDFPHAAEYYERSLNAYDEAGIDLAGREVNSDRAIFYLMRGDTIRA